MSGFHGITAVAELKRTDTRRTARVGLGGFHGITAVAELKRGLVRGTRATGSCEFPRHHRRGRIEANPSETRPRRDAMSFHGITAVAELKHRQSGRQWS